jgi:hypothetical protein|tara:strand:- start:125 stop:415 length:291 start_codon:yes stop_codon:yes gene_type:complete
MSGKKWDKEAFMTSFHANSGKKHATWAGFHKAMNAAATKAGAGGITELRLAMRCGAVNAQIKKAGMDPWVFTARPKKAAVKPPSVADIAKRIMSGK